jgi:hypothetical protein
MMRVSSLEPLTTLRVLATSMQYVAKTADPKYSQFVSIVCKVSNFYCFWSLDIFLTQTLEQGGLNRIPNLKCTQMLGIIAHGGHRRIMLRISRSVTITAMLQLVNIEDVERPLWICILSDWFIDLV